MCKLLENYYIVLKSELVVSVFLIFIESVQCKQFPLLRRNLACVKWTYSAWVILRRSVLRDLAIVSPGRGCFSGPAAGLPALTVAWCGSGALRSRYTLVLLVSWDLVGTELLLSFSSLFVST